MLAGACLAGYTRGEIHSHGGTMRSLILAVALLLAPLAATADGYTVQPSAPGTFVLASLQCGIKPIPPIGCSSADAMCICDEDGNCYWVFVGCG